MLLKRPARHRSIDPENDPLPNPPAGAKRQKARKRQNHSLLEPADREHSALQRDFAGHPDGASQESQHES
jgi:hypothetical protein